MDQTPKHIAVAGATGAVGIEILECLEQRNFPVSELTLLASARSAGRTLTFGGEEITVKELTPDSFEGVDIALFSAGGGISTEFAPHAVAAGAVVVDNSSAFRLDEGVPLVIPEVNPHDAKEHNGIIANPNCTTIVTLMALNPMHRAFSGVTSIIASSYQAVYPAAEPRALPSWKSRSTRSPTTNRCRSATCIPTRLPPMSSPRSTFFRRTATPRRR